MESRRLLVWLFRKAETDEEKSPEQEGSPRHDCSVPNQTLTPPHVTVLHSFPNCLSLVHLLLLVKSRLLKNANVQVLVPEIRLEICVSLCGSDAENRRRHRITMLRMTSCSSRKHARDSDRCGCQSVELAREGEGISYIILPLQGHKVDSTPLNWYAFDTGLLQDQFSSSKYLVLSKWVKPGENRCEQVRRDVHFYMFYLILYHRVKIIPFLG